ncbi:MAG: hypothetical protein ABWX90_01580 [Candidatus Saccharimonadales bacterium]
MTFIMILLSMVVALFVLAFITNRRFGIRGLALATGAMIATLWVGDLTPIIAQAGFALSTPPLESVVAVVLTLLPAILLILSGQPNKSILRRVVGSLLFVLLAVVLLLEPIGAALVIEGPGDQLYALLTQYRVVIITVCLIVAILDLAFTKIPKIPSKH